MCGAEAVLIPRTASDFTKNVITYLKSSKSLLRPDGFESNVMEEPPSEEALPRTPPILLNKELELFGFAAVLNMVPLAAKPLMA